MGGGLVAVSLPPSSALLSIRYTRAKEHLILDYDPLEGYRDAQGYNVEDAGYDADYPLTAQLAREHGGPLTAAGSGMWHRKMVSESNNKQMEQDGRTDCDFFMDAHTEMASLKRSL